MKFLRFLISGFSSSGFIYKDNNAKYIIYQKSKIFWIPYKNKLTECDSIETLKEVDDRCGLGLFK